MRYQELKFRVANFDDIQVLFDRAGIQPAEPVVSMHYYAQGMGQAVTKLVVQGEVAAIHILDAEDGKFILRESIPVENKQAGLVWLRDRGVEAVALVTMTHTNYEYQGGIVGLYNLNDVLNSVILDYPPGRHESVRRELGLRLENVILVPYNVYLEKLGLLKPAKLETIT